jgi:hypothetical protein
VSDTIASLAVTLDTSRVKPGVADINAIVPAAKGAQAAVTALQSAAKPAGDALNVMSTASKSAASAHGGLSSQSQAAMHSVRSLIDATVAGISPIRALAMESGRLAYAGTAGFTGLGAAFTKVVSPLGLVGVGLGVVAAAGGIAIATIAGNEVALANLGERAQTSVGYLHGLTEAMAFKGVGTEEAAKDLTTIADETLAAKNNMGVLYETFKANNLQAGSLQQNVSTLANLIKNASEPQKYNILQQLGLSDTRSAVQFWSEGAAGIKSMTDAAVQFSQSADEGLISKSRAFSDAWNRDSTLVANGLKSAAITGYDAFSLFGNYVDSLLNHIVDLGGNKLKQAFAGSLTVGSTLTTSSSNIDDYYKATGAGRAGSSASGAGGSSGDDGTKDLTTTKAKIAQSQLYISTLGNLATIQDEVKAKQNALDLANIAGAGVTKTQRDAIIEYTRAAALGLIAIRQQTAEQGIALTTADMSIGKATEYRAVQEQVNAALLKGIQLKPQEISQLQKEATVLGQATQAAATYKVQLDAIFSRSMLGLTDSEQSAAQAMRQLRQGDWQAHMNDDLASFIKVNAVLTDLKSTSQTALSGFLSDLASGKNGAIALQNALQSVEKKAARHCIEPGDFRIVSEPRQYQWRRWRNCW